MGKTTGAEPVMASGLSLIAPLQHSNEEAIVASAETLTPPIGIEPDQGQTGVTGYA